MKDNKFYIGLTLTILAFLACVITDLIIIYVLPIFIIGVILILISKKTIWIKVLSIILPMILLLVNIYGENTPETYLIPEDFNGRFRVIYEERCGIKTRREDGRRVLEIPKKRILIIKAKYEDGPIDHLYYLVDSEGHRTKVPMLHQGTNNENKTIGVFLLGNGIISGQMSDGSFSTESPLAIYYNDYFVVNGDSIQNEDFIKESHFDSLTNVYVGLCRQKK
jgi:hypothetical protein